MPKSPILGGFSTARSKNAADNAAVNLAVEVTESKDGKVPGFLFLPSGLDLVASLGAGPIRGVLPLNDILYVVSGPQVWSLTPNGIATLCGTIGISTAPVSMFQNKRQLMIVDGSGGWIVPGGYPLTGGTIQAPGGLYAVNDTVTLQTNTGSQTSFPIIRISSITNNPVTGFLLPNAGTTYNSAVGVATTPIQPNPGIGTGFWVNVVAAGGPILSSTLNLAGSNYAIGDTGTISGAGTRDAVYYITGVTAGAVTSYILLNAGTAYATVTASTTSGTGIQNNLGSGFTLDIAASAGPITDSSISFGGAGYVVGNAGFVSGGTGDATYLVTSVGPVGSVTGFVIVQPGAIDPPGTSLTQNSTSGSGSGLVINALSFGDFVGLVPVDLPFPNPIVGGISDGFGLLVFQDQQNVAASALLDLSTWPALSFGMATQSPDNCISLHVVHDEVYIQKTDNTEIWINQGTSPFPFGPITSVHMEVGSVAPFSGAIANEDLLWLSRNGQGEGIVFKATGSKSEPISTQALVAEFGKYPNLGDAIAYARQEGQHVYYVITFPEANKTWCYDKTASELVGYPLWHELAAFDNGQFNRHWGNAFTPWRGSGTITQTIDSYEPEGVVVTAPTILQSLSGLNGLPLSFPAFVFSVWLDLSDAAATGINFNNQDVTNPGLLIVVRNSATGTPQIVIEAWDTDAAPIVVATYDFSVWSTWVNILISMDTATNQLQVYANTVVAGSLVEDELTPVSLTWFSTNPIAVQAAQPWHITTV